MAHLNKIMLVGNLGSDPKTTQGGFVKLSLATSETYKKDGKIKSTTEWHNIIIFNEHLAKYASSYFKKGMTVYAEGKITYRDYTDNDGNKKNVVDIVIGKQHGDLKIISKPKEEPEQQTKPSQPIHNSDSVDKYFDGY